MAHQEERHGDGNLVLQQKHAAMLRRLAAKEEARHQISSARRAGYVASADPEESTDRFLLSFSETCRKIELHLSSHLGMESSSSSAQVGSLSLKDSLERLALELSELERHLAEKTYFLPAFEVRSCQDAVSSLREKIDSANARLLPKKRFSFKSKTSKDQRSIEEDGKDTKILQTSAAKVIEEGNELSEKERSKVSLEGLNAFASCRIHDIKDSIIVRDLKHEKAEEITLENLAGCKVFLKGECRALYIHQLENCEVYSGPITSSALIDEVQDCILMLASHQIRIHHTKRTDLYLRVRSRPIVEYTSDVRVAPYSFSYHGIEDDLLQANLQEETGLWQNVDDFRWLRAVPSPHWCILPEANRLPLIDGTSVIEGGRLQT